MIPEDQNQVVRDALRITNILNQHLLNECPHCRDLLKQVEFNDSNEED